MTKHQPDGGAVVELSMKVIDGTELHADLPDKFGLERHRLQLDDEIAREPDLVEEHIGMKSSSPMLRRTCEPTKANPWPSSRRNFST